MDWWVRWAWENAPSWARSIVVWLIKFVTGVVGVVASALYSNKTAWVQLYRSLTQLRDALSGFIPQVGRSLLWLRNTWVPRFFYGLRDALSLVISTVRAALIRAYRAADALIDRAWRAATALLRRLIDYLARWAREAVNALWRVIPERIRRAWLLLLNPLRLAEWAAHAVFFALVRLAEREVEAIGRWLLGRGVRFTMMLARVMIRVIERVL